MLIGCSGVGFERFEEPSGFFIVAVGDQYLDSFQRFFKLPAISLVAHTNFGAFHPFGEFFVFAAAEHLFGVADKGGPIAVEPGFVVVFCTVVDELFLLLLGFGSPFVLLFARHPLTLLFRLDESGEPARTFGGLYVFVSVGGASIFLLHGEDFSLALADFQSAGAHARLQIGVFRVEELHFLQLLEGFVIIALLFEYGGAGEKFADAGGLIDLLGCVGENLFGLFGIGVGIERCFGLNECFLPVAFFDCGLGQLETLHELLSAHLGFGQIAVGQSQFRCGLGIVGAQLECIFCPVVHAVPLLFLFALLDFGHGREVILFVFARGGFCHRLFLNLALGFELTLGLCLCVAQGCKFLVAEFVVFFGFGFELVEVDVAIDGNNAGQVAAPEINEVFFAQTVAGRDGFCVLVIGKAVSEKEDAAEHFARAQRFNDEVADFVDHVTDDYLGAAVDFFGRYAHVEGIGRHREAHARYVEGASASGGIELAQPPFGILL